MAAAILGKTTEQGQHDEIVEPSFYEAAREATSVILSERSDDVATLASILLEHAPAELGRESLAVVLESFQAPQGSRRHLLTGLLDA